MRKPIPAIPTVPSTGEVIKWMKSITAYLYSQHDADVPLPMPVQLAFLEPTSSAAINGVLMFDRTAKKVVVSVDGVWVVLT